MSLAIATRYARALVDVVTAPASGVDPAAALDQLRSFQGLVRDSADLRNVLLSPAVPPARKRAVVRELGEALRLATPVMNFLFVVIDHRRVGLLGSMAQAFEAVLDEKLGRVRAEIRSAMPLTGEQGEALLAQLRQMTGRQVRPEFITDESLLGGVTARIGSTIYDGSVRGRLEALRAQLGRG